jgi:hypothetical protein
MIDLLVRTISASVWAAERVSLGQQMNARLYDFNLHGGPGGSRECLLDTDVDVVQRSREHHGGTASEPFIWKRQCAIAEDLLNARPSMHQDESSKLRATGVAVLIVGDAP